MSPPTSTVRAPNRLAVSPAAVAATAAIAVPGISRRPMSSCWDTPHGVRKYTSGWRAVGALNKWGFAMPDLGGLGRGLTQRAKHASQHAASKLAHNIAALREVIDATIARRVPGGATAEPS